jgi:putative IMPACT (imprinted ancient) family translation regulator
LLVQASVTIDTFGFFLAGEIGGSKKAEIEKAESAVAKAATADKKVQRLKAPNSKHQVPVPQSRDQ